MFETYFFWFVRIANIHGEPAEPLTCAVVPAAGHLQDAVQIHNNGV